MKPDLKKLLVNMVEPHLSNLGFKRKGNRFYLIHNDLAKMVEVQFSSRSSRDTVMFTINLGVYSRTIASITGQEPYPRSWDHCHWKQRIGHVSPHQRDQWWTVSDGNALETPVDECMELLLRFGIPAIQGIATTADLEELWRSGVSPGLTEVERNRYQKFLRAVKESD